MTVGIKNRHTVQRSLWKDPASPRRKQRNHFTYSFDNGTENGSVNGYNGTSSETDFVCTLTLRGPRADVEKAKLAIELTLYHGNNLAGLAGVLDQNLNEVAHGKIVRTLALAGSPEDIKKAHRAIELRMQETRELIGLISQDENSRLLQITGTPDEVHKAQSAIALLLEHGEPQKTPSKYYLPKALHGASVLQQVDQGRFRAVNADLQARTQGLNYRASKHIDDKLLFLLNWGCEVIAVDEGDGWVRIKEEVIPSDELEPVPPTVATVEFGQSIKEQSKSLPSYDIPDIIQFASVRFYCREGSPTLTIEVVRGGTCSAEASVEYHTEDGSAKAGLKYVSTKGKLSFAPRETRKTLEVQLLDDNNFDATLDFHVLLNNVDGAILGRHLSNCQVVIVDNDEFPSNAHADSLRAGKVYQIDHWALITDYLMVNLRGKRFRCRVLKFLLGDQIMNLKYLYIIFLFNYLMDDVLRPCCGKSPPDDAIHRVGVIALLLLAPYFVVWITTLLQVSLKIPGIANSQLQSSLFRTALRYSDQSWQYVAISDLVMAITRDVPEVVDYIFTNFLGLFAKLGRLVMLAAMVFWQARKKSTFEVLIQASQLLGFILFLLVFLRIRESGTTKRREKVFRTQTDHVALVQQVGQCYRLITDYSQQSSVVHMFMERVKLSCAAILSFSRCSVTNQLFAPFLGTVAVGIYIYYASRDVLEDNSPLGEFITGITLWWEIGQCFNGMYSNFLSMSDGVAPLQNVTYYMNLPLRSLDEMKTCTHALSEGRKMMVTAQRECGKDEYAWNNLPLLTGRDISFSYADGGGSSFKILDKACFSIPQGKLIGVTGRRGAGKATLLKVIGGVLLPEGELFVPAHLRVLHVGLPPQLMGELDIFQNVCFGPSDGADETPERVMRILRRLGLSAWVIKAVEAQSASSASAELEASRVNSTQSSLFHHHHQKKKVQNAFNVQGQRSFGTGFSAVMRKQQQLKKKEQTIFSQSQLMLIHVARALVMNPDVLVIHNPWSYLDDATGPVVTKLLREFVDLRGVENPPELLHERKLRTCIFTSTTQDIEADLILTLRDMKVTCTDVQKEVPKTIVTSACAPEQWVQPEVAIEAGTRYSRRS